MAFNQIEEALANPFFESNCLGKEAIRQHVLPLEKCTDCPPHIQFAEWTKGDSREMIYYSLYDSKIGRLLIANTSKGVCFVGFAHKGDDAILNDLRRRFPHQTLKEQTSDWQQSAIDYCNGNRQQTVSLHVKGTDFQVDIWKKLVRIPEGKLSTYGSLVPGCKGAQAIGNAVGANPVSYIIPCHRVVKNDGSFRGYYWGTELKRQLLAYELQGNCRQ